MWVLLSSDLVISLNETSSNLASQIIPNHYSDFLLFLRVIVICDWTIFVFCLQHFRSRIVCLLCVRYCSIDYNRILNGTMAIIRFSCNCIFSLFRVLWLMWMWVFIHITHYYVPIMSVPVFHWVRHVSQIFFSFLLNTLCAQLYFIEINRWTSKWHVHTLKCARARTLTCICVNVCSYSYLLRSKYIKPRKKIFQRRRKNRTAFESFNWIKIQQKQKKNQHRTTHIHALILCKNSLNQTIY